MALEKVECDQGVCLADPTDCGETWFISVASGEVSQQEKILHYRNDAFDAMFDFINCKTHNFNHSKFYWY